MDKVSIIVPVYNGDKYLSRCLESLVNQTYSTIEIICINDGSTDNSLSVLQKYEDLDKRVILINKKNEGVSKARNDGIRKASGKYVCFCDCDDFYELNYVEIMYNTIKEQGVAVVKCNYRVVSKDNKFISSGDVFDFSSKLIKREEIESSIIPRCLNGSIPCFSYLIMIDKSKLKVKFPTDIAMMEDVVFYIRLLLSIPSLYIINNSLYTIMYNDEGATNNVDNYKRNILNIFEVNEYIKKDLKKYNILTEGNSENLNINHLNAISDFIFKYYLYSNGDIIELCKDIRCDKLLEMVNNINLNKINIQRRLILKYITHKHYLLLRVYFFIRKIIFKLRRK